MLNLFLSDKKTNTRMLPFNNMNKIMSFYGDNMKKGTYIDNALSKKVE